MMNIGGVMNYFSTSNQTAGGAFFRGPGENGQVAAPLVPAAGAAGAEAGAGISGLFGSVRAEIVTFRLEARAGSFDGAGEQARVADFGSAIGQALPELNYGGRPISSLSPGGAAELVSEDGFFGVRKTADRLAGFVLGGAGDDLDKLKAGREGILQGFAAAEKVWGGELPAISHETLAEALKQVDEKISDLDGHLVDLSA